MGTVFGPIRFLLSTLRADQGPRQFAHGFFLIAAQLRGAHMKMLLVCGTGLRPASEARMGSPARVAQSFAARAAPAAQVEKRRGVLRPFGVRLCSGGFTLPHLACRAVASAKAGHSEGRMRRASDLSRSVLRDEEPVDVSSCHPERSAFCRVEGSRLDSLPLLRGGARPARATRRVAFRSSFGHDRML